ncbi:MAG: hypothetical protein KGI54_17305 [Pseudomonadota bacterium]|nr:hypothetical protein [Pseudomonadota bacterium]
MMRLSALKATHMIALAMQSIPQAGKLGLMTPADMMAEIDIKKSSKGRHPPFIASQFSRSQTKGSYSSKYMPHQGTKEKARRLRQLAANTKF